jgi:pyridoxine kinase
VAGPDLPLAKATEKVLASMHAVLKDTARHYNEVAEALKEGEEKPLNEGNGKEANEEVDTHRHLKLTRAAEVRVVRNARVLREPPDLDQFKAMEVVIDDGSVENENEKVEADELGVVKVAGGQSESSHQT